MRGLNSILNREVALFGSKLGFWKVGMLEIQRILGKVGSEKN